MALVRQFGWTADDTAGGSNYDVIVAAPFSGTIPDATEWWPITGGTLDKGSTNINRDAEARGRRARTSQLPFQSAPTETIPVAAYHSIAKKVLKYALGREGTVTGAGPFTHPLRAVEYTDNVNYLPTVHTQLARDDLNQKMSGASINRVTFDFPLDGEATMEVEFHGLYQQHYGTAVPEPDFTLVSENPLALRDAQVFVDGSLTAIPDLQGFRIAWVNNLFVKPYAGRNIRVLSIGTPARTRKVWYPHLRKLGPAQDVTFGLVFGNTNSGQELAEEFQQIEKYVFEVVGDPLAPGPGTELLRFTIFNGSLTDGGAGPLAARDDLTSDFNGQAWFSEADGKDVLVEVVDGDNAAIAIA